MTPRERNHPLRRLLVQSHRAVLRTWAVRSSLRGAAIAAVVIAAAVVLGAARPLGETASWARLVAVLVLCALGTGFAVTRYLRASVGFELYLERIERRFPEVRSWLRNALDFQVHPPRDTSAELAHAVSEEAALRVRGVPLEALRPRLEPRRPLLGFGLSLLVIVGLGLVLPERVSRSWTTLWNPALAAPPIRLEVEPGSVKITPGAALAVRARVWGTARRPDLLRDREPVLAAHSEGQNQDGARLWRFDLTQLTREQYYRVRVAGVQSPRYRIALAGEPMPVSFQVEYRSPAYARLPVQRAAATRGELSALRGTRALIEVTFDRDLRELSARLPGGANARWSPVTARRWRGEIAVEREGEYELVARCASGEGRDRYRITPLPDAPPVITVQLPSGDLDLPAGQQIPLEILGQDDLGLSELRLQHRRDPAAPWTDVPLARFPGYPREAAVRTRWDASPLGLLPGETATFRFELFDDNAIGGRGRAVSPSFELRFPSLADLYEKLDQTQGGVQNTLEKVADQARELQKSLDKLARQPQRSTDSPSSFERSEELKGALQQQQQLTGKLDEAARQLQETLQQAAEREAFDQELTRKIQEMSELMQQIQSRELREAVRRMQEALENLDRHSMERSLPQWRREQNEMIKNLERTIELLKQIRQEERLQALARRAEELKAQQDALNREHEAEERARASARESERKALAEQQQRAAEQSEQLAKDARALQAEMQSADARQELEQSASELEQEAAREQREASRSAMQGQSQRARQQGQQASESLKSAATRLQNLMKSLQQSREGADLAAVRRAAQDLVSLQRETENNLGSNAPTGERANRQTDLSEGVSRVADSLYSLAQKSPFISPKLSESLGRAISSLSASGRELGGGNRQRGEDLGRGGGIALNEAVLELRDAESSMCQSPGPDGNPLKPGDSVQRLGELGERQSQLNSETRTLAQRLSQQLRLSSGNRDQLLRLAEQQRRLREQLEQIQRDDESRRELLGKLDAAKREMKEVEETLQSGATEGDLEEKQQRILSRLLDAQRSINRRDFNPERESRTGEDIARRSAPELPQELLREADRLRLDLLKAEADRYPAQYRTFVEAYLRKLNGGR
jgi:hypothetical protein